MHTYTPSVVLCEAIMPHSLPVYADTQCFWQGFWFPLSIFCRFNESFFERSLVAPSEHLQYSVLLGEQKEPVGVAYAIGRIRSDLIYFTYGLKLFCFNQCIPSKGNCNICLMKMNSYK